MQPENLAGAADRSVTGRQPITQLFIAVDDRVPASSVLASLVEAADWSRADDAASGAYPRLERVSIFDPVTRRRLQGTLARVSSARLIVVYPNPGIHLAGKLEAQPSPQPLELWCREAAELLDLARRHRRQVLLIDGHAASADAAGLADQFRDRLGVVLTRTALPEPTTHGIVRLIAEEAIRSDPEANRLAAELQASSLPLSAPVASSVVELLGEWQKPSAEQRQMLEGLESENATLLEQLHRVQEDLEPFLLAAGGSSELAAAEANLAATQRELNNLRAQLADRARQVEAIYASRSWKLTAPLRRGLALLGGDKS